MNDKTSPENPAADGREAAPGNRRADVQVLESAHLFRGRLEIVIRHNGRDYRLRQTRLGKLILTA